MLRLAIANIYRPGALTPSVVMSLGLGLAVLVTITQIDGNLRRQFLAALPDRAPSFYFIDIPSTQAAPFDDYLRLPLLVKEDDFRSAHHVVAVKQAEHQPMIERQFPTWLDRVEFWHIHDLDCCGPEEAIPNLNREVAALVERFMAISP